MMVKSLNCIMISLAFHFQISHTYRLLVFTTACKYILSLLLIIQSRQLM